MINVADPAETVPDPNCVVPSKKITVPVGATPIEGIVATNVTGFDRKAGFGEAVSNTTGLAGTTVRVTVAVPVV